ncbi:MAG: diguanylate cyclase [Pseudomonas sp.]|uniref:diguanylate cyclase n=1 Tax=Pseudomonas sp. TaxID=306 RepID=UPI0027360F4B|nr:diguanylate cyclase [Pseudomonas sp.]MDP3847780.1 diguanylate cyclase [Pseudomonas sp.]
MSDDSERWKAKYLQGLEDQEKLELRWDARLDLLRRGLVRSSLAAEGTDKAVDQCMQELRDILRRDDIDAGLSGLIPRLEKAVLDSEHRRVERMAQISVALGALVGQLQGLPLPREISKPLKSFAKQLESRSGQLRELPVLLGELSALQRQALAIRDVDESARPGLLQRLFGSRDGATVAAPASTADTLQSAVVEPAPVHATAQTATLSESPSAAVGESTAIAQSVTLPVVEAPRSVVAPEPVAPESATASGSLADVVAPANSKRPAATLDSLPLPAGLFAAEPVPGAATPALAPAQPAAALVATEYALPVSPEPGYSVIAGHVEKTLLGLLDVLPLPERHQPQAEELRNRITGGLNFYELVPVLDDFAVLMLAVADMGQREFEGYLKQLNERLATFQGSLKDAHEGYADSMSAARELDSALREQVGGLHSSVEDATELDQLKQVVEGRLNGLLSTMDQYQRQRGGVEQVMAERLQTLVERVASMEVEAKGFRDHLEEQRQKALTDPLTGLPNRAAWDERLELEMARWQRYGGDLLLGIVDIDHFKRINDNYGHLAGDKVLKIIADELSKRLRKTDFMARFGGEEFALLIPSTPLAGAEQLLETLRAAIEACPFHFKGERVTITLSAGISAFVSGERSEAVFERADQALYRAKRGGRNRTELG